MTSARDLHDDCLDILRRHAADLTANETARLNYVAGWLAAGVTVALAEQRAARSIIWSFHCQGPGRAAPVIA